MGRFHKDKQRKLRPLRLFLCVEGESEGKYFRFCKEQKIGNLTDVKIKAASSRQGEEIQQKFKKIIKENIEEHRKKDIYCVFDLDRCSLEKMKKKLSSLKNENCSITFCPSRPCFEVWLLFHFQYTSREFANCREVEVELNRCIGSKKFPNYPKYNKTSYSITFQDFLKENQDTACERAKGPEKSICSASSSSGKTSNGKPCSSEIYKIFQYPLPTS